jgi:hypothetical protein
LKRLGKFNIFWVGQGNDALKASHHTRVEGDQDLAYSIGKCQEQVAAPLKKADP